MHPEENCPSIYFDPIGSIKIINGHLGTILPVDISFIKSHLYKINDILDITRNMCDQSIIF